VHDQFANAFYGSALWQRTRKMYREQHHGLCERCLKRGLIVPGDEVHHKTPLTPENIHDPRITISPANLELLCKACHEAEHGDARRWRVDAAGTIELR